MYDVVPKSGKRAYNAGSSRALYGSIGQWPWHRIFRTVLFIVPNSMFSDERYEWDVLSADKARKILNTPLPSPSPENSALSIETVVQNTIGKVFLWIPAEHAIDSQTFVDEPYSSVYARRIKSGKATVGEWLASMVSGGTEMGYPLMRYLNEAPFAPTAMDDDRRASLPKLMDVVFITRRYIVIVALPRE